jgi:hypothetical protein
MTHPLREDPALSAGPDAAPAPTKADEVAAAVAAAPGVAALSDGRLGGVSTYVAGVSPVWSSARAISRYT